MKFSTLQVTNRMQKMKKEIQNIFYFRFCERAKICVYRQPLKIQTQEIIFFFQAEDGIRDRSPSRGLGDVYKRQIPFYVVIFSSVKQNTILNFSQFCQVFCIESLFLLLALLLIFFIFMLKIKFVDRSWKFNS